MPEPPVAVQNNLPGPAVFSDLALKVAIEWEGKGHIDPRTEQPSGRDIRLVPHDVIVSNVNFIEAVNRGDFTLLNASEAVEHSLSQQAQAWNFRNTAADEQARAVIDQSSKPFAVVQMDEAGRVTDGDPAQARPAEPAGRPVPLPQ